MAAKLYWDLVPSHTRAFDPENGFICATGPLAGIKRLAGSRWQICGKSAVMDPQQFSYANLGGSFGAWLKFAGYDALVVQGRADTPVYLTITWDESSFQNVLSAVDSTRQRPRTSVSTALLTKPP